MLRFATLRSIAVLCAAVTIGCSKGDAATDSTLERDLALAGQLNPVDEPTLADTARAPEPATPAPPAAPRPRTQPVARPAPAPAPAPVVPAPAAPTTGSVATGARMVLTSGTRVCTNTHAVGDRFTAVLRDGMIGSNGAIIPAGSSAEVEITALKRSENSSDEIVIGLVVRSVTVEGRRYVVDAETKSYSLEKIRASNDAKKVVGGAVVGAVIGQVLGRDTRSTVIGAATGAAAGTAAAVATANHEGCVPEDGRIEAVLTSALTIDLTS